MSNELKFYYQNTRGLRTKIIDSLRNKITLANYDCISFTETWLNDTHESNEIFNETYNVFRSDHTVEKYNRLRINRPDLRPEADVIGGGCLIALKRNISALRMIDWENEKSFDNVWLKINTHGNSKIFMNTIYIPGWASFDQVNLYFEQLFDIINNREPYARYIILGDFNLPSIDWYHDGTHCIPVAYEGRLANELINTMLTANLLQRNHIKNIYNRTLDLMLSSMNFTVNKSHPFVKEDNYHPSLGFKLDSANIKFIHGTRKPKLNYFKTNYDGLNEDIKRVDWTNLLNFQDVAVILQLPIFITPYEFY